MPFLTQGKTNWKFLSIVIILAVIVGAGALWFSMKQEFPNQLPEVKKKNETYCNQDSDCVFLTFQCCSTPNPCHSEPPEVVNKNSKDKKEEELKLKCSLPCPQYSPSICSECLDLEIFTSVCLNNKCDVRREINCDNYCKAIAKDKSKPCPWISKENLITEENTKKCNCETASWKTYRNEQYGFEIKYPDNFFWFEPKVEPIKCEYANFSEDCPYINFEGQKVEKKQALDKGMFEVEKTTINQIPYCFWSFSEGAAGSEYVTYDYTTIKDGKCFSVYLVIQYTNCGVFGGPEEEAYKKCEQGNNAQKEILEQVVSTFRFIDEFCGTSTNGSCVSNLDCVAGGCSEQVCQSKNEESIVTTCEYKDCYNAQSYGLNCKCVDKKCQWAK